MAELWSEGKKTLLSSVASSSTTRKLTPDSRNRHITFVSPRTRGTIVGSPALRTPAVVPVNDDEAERRQRRRENHLRSVMSPGCHTPRSAAQNPERGRTAESSTSNFSNTQIAEHYSTCIKLSTENKINAKNAFGLHLIDCMAEMLRKRGEMTNFQVAGCTLDASAKIYAGRVDSIYNDAYKMLGGLGRPDSKTRDNDSGDRNTEDDQRQTQPGKRRGKKSSSSVQVLEKNLKSLDVDTFDLEFEVDPLFKKTSSTFDEGGVDGLLINQLGVDSDQCVLMLDSSIPIATIDRPIANGELTTDGRDLKAYFKSIQNFQSLQICPTFSSFKFNEASSAGEWDMLNLLSPRGAHNGDYHKQAMPDEADYSASQCFDDNVDYDNPDTSGMVAEPLADDRTVLGVCGDNRILQRVERNTGENTKQSEFNKLISGELCLTDTIQLSEYSYFNPTVLSAWAGPGHWKLRPRNKESDKESDNEVKPKKRGAVPKVFRVDVYTIPDPQVFTKGRAATILSKNMLSRLTTKQTTLPCDLHTDASRLYQLFCRPKWKVRRKRHASTEVVDPTEIDGDFYNYDNANDNTGYSLTVDDDQHYDDSEPADMVQLSGRQFMNMLDEPQTLSQHLIDEPKKVTPLQIDYARQAKRLDVKRLKTTMWDVISDDIKSKEGDRECLSFSTLCSRVAGQVSTAMAKELSVPILCVCLLHLANEKVLHIDDQEDMADFIISLSSNISQP